MLQQLYNAGYKGVSAHLATLTNTEITRMADDSIVKQIPLSQGQFALVDAENYDFLITKNWYAWDNRRGGFYARHSIIGGEKIYMHRLIMDASKGIYIDHINGNGLDNRRCNLRICTNQQNHRNKSKNFGNSLYKGVAWHKKAKKWEAYIKYNKKNHLGLFLTQEEAALAYNIAAKKYFGEFAKLNEIPNEGYSWNIL